MDKVFDNQQYSSLTVLDLEISFRPGTDMERAKVAAKLLEDRYSDHKSRAQGLRSKDIILTYLALGLADELLQMKTKQEQMQNHLRSLLAKIEKSL